MSNINDEMKASADNAIKAANERFGQKLDFSEQSIAKLENLLVQIYWSFSNHAVDKGEGGEIFKTANIWGSYLGEYMRLKWGGTWILKGSDPLISIKNITFSPISLVNLKITSHPEYRVENYLIETKRIIYSSGINPQQSQELSENIDQPKKQISINQSSKPETIDKHILFTLAGIVGILLIIVASIIGYKNIKAGGISAFGLIASTTNATTNIPSEKTLVTTTSYSINSQNPTVTTLPTYTPNPTFTLHPSFTPHPTNTRIASMTPTETQKPFVLKPTLAPRMSPTRVPVIPTNTPAPPKPTATEPAPVGVESCEINPFTVPFENNVPITFIVHFSSNIPGYGFDVAFDPDLGQSGCPGIDNDGDGMAFCDGSSGKLTALNPLVYVTFNTSAGKCIASYSAR